MSTDHALAPNIKVIDPDEILQKALHHNDPEAGLLVAVLYQAVLITLHDLLDEFETEPDQFMAQVTEMLNHLGGSDTPTLN